MKEGVMSEADADFWLNDPSLEKRRFVVTAEMVQSLIEDHLRAIGLTDLSRTSNMWFWSAGKGNEPPEVIVVQLPEAST